jgi:hypothetical protein
MPAEGRTSKFRELGTRAALSFLGAPPKSKGFILMLEDDYICRTSAGIHIWVHPDFPDRHWTAADLLNWAKDHELPPRQLKEVIRVSAILLRLNAAARS